MLSHALFALLIGAIVLLGGGTILLVAIGALDPLIVTIASSVVTLVGASALVTLLLQRQRQRVRRELHTIRRSQMQRERVPERYGDLVGRSKPPSADDASAEAGRLTRSLPNAAPPPPVGEGASPDTIRTALEAGLLTLMVEPVIEMPRNRAVAFRAHPALPDADAPLSPAALDGLDAHTRAKLELWTMGAALDAAEEKLRLPVQCDVSPALLGNAEDGIGLQAILEDFPPELLAIRCPAAGLDALESGRLANAVGVGATLVAIDAVSPELERSDALDLLDRGYATIATSVHAGEPNARGRALTMLAEAGVVLQADGVRNAEQGADLAAHGFTIFTGTPFGEPRRLRDLAERTVPSEPQGAD